MKPSRKVTFIEGKFHVYNLSLLKVSGDNSFAFRKNCHFYVEDNVYGDSLVFLGKCFGIPVRVWWRHIAFITLSYVWSRWQRIGYHDMGCLLNELLIVGLIRKVIMLSYGWAIDGWTHSQGNDVILWRFLSFNFNNLNCNEV